MRPVGLRRPLCALTIDVEDWYQSVVDIESPLSPRLTANVDRLLQLLDEAGVKATFFVVGDVARQLPSLVHRLVGEGHEVQSHGDRHVSLRSMDGRHLQQFLERSRAVIEDVTGRPVTSFRAPYFSIVRDNLSALDAVAEAGFQVDSSIFPMRLRRYGIAGTPLEPHYRLTRSGRQILEAPVAVAELATVCRIPAAGGGYLRVFPFALTRRLDQLILWNDRPVILYSHPYELDVQEMASVGASASWRTRWLQGIGRPAMADRLRSLLRSLPFGRLDEVLAGWGYLRPPQDEDVPPKVQLQCA